RGAGAAARALTMAIPIVAIVGRPNVGKSTLFNHLVGRRAALVHDRPGVTVDRIERMATLPDGRQVMFVDTGGIGEPDVSPQAPWIARQVEFAIQLADLVLFVVDARTGPVAADEDIAQRLRREGKRTLLVVNKAEKPHLEAPFYALGLGEPIPVSAKTGRNIERLYARIAEALPPSEPAEMPQVIAHLAVIGRPNAGKSTLINAWLGEERMTTSPIPGTTRDAVDSFLHTDQGLVRLIDTAGIRRRARIEDELEAAAVARARRALAEADAAALVLDATNPEGAAAQDLRLAHLAFEEGAALVLALNKADAVSPGSRRWVEERLAFRFRAFPRCDVVWISAKERRGTDVLLRALLAAAARNRTRITTGRLNRWLQKVQKMRPPPAVEGRPVKLKYAVQV
ncbi:MAG: ribosome biogenesis GTPase Der, partial [Zetaproteobacteria bacterium]